MKELLDSPVNSRVAPQQVFYCPEESTFYAHCLELLVLRRCLGAERVVEFGSGDGSPVIQALLRTNFQGTVHGYELNSAACQAATAAALRCGLAKQYVIHPHCFFTAKPQEAAYLVANPPYLPAVDNDLYLPLLHGGTDGAQISNQLLSLAYPNALLMISSYSNPVETVYHAKRQGYVVADFMAAPLKMGYYSSEAKVKQQIGTLRRQGKAFLSASKVYILAGVLFTQQHCSDSDLSSEFINVITSL